MHDTEILKLIVAVVAKAAGLKRSDQMYAMGKHPNLSKLRDTALYLIRKKTTLSYPEIAMAFHRDHSSIISAVKRENLRLSRTLPRRPDGKTLTEWHAFLLQQVESAIAAQVATNLPN
jgi:hypothetical protein